MLVVRHAGGHAGRHAGEHARTTCGLSSMLIVRHAAKLVGVTCAVFWLWDMLVGMLVIFHDCCTTCWVHVVR